MNVADVISRYAERTPHAPAVIERERTWSYAEFDASIWRAAAALRKRGIAPGDVVGVTLPSNALHLVAGYALARIGAVQLPLPQRESEATRRSLAQRFRASCLLTETDADPSWLEPGGDSPAPELRAPGGDAPWKLVMTSGTTGAHKAVLQSHAMHVAWAEITQAALPVSADGRYLVVVPLDFFAGFRMCMDAHWGGAAVVIGETPRSNLEVLELIERYGVNYLYLTPLHLHQLVPALPAGSAGLPGLRRVRAGSMVVSQTLRRDVLCKLTPNFVVTYGTNEIGATPFTTAAKATLERFPGSIGFPVDGVEVQIADDAGLRLPAGETGLIRVRLPGMPREYVDNPEAGARAFRDGWYYPGDLGMLVPEGALYFKGRADDLMNFDGIKIYPSEIEAALLEHPAVAEAAAFPLRSTIHQDVPCAAVVLRAQASAEALRQFCFERLGTRAPVHVVVMKELPRSAAGKVLKRELARLAQKRSANGG
jgi:acyl-CoA synthetase (AMP-forming)/AMP-acid ligase II